MSPGLLRFLMNLGLDFGGYRNGHRHLLRIRHSAYRELRKLPSTWSSSQSPCRIRLLCLVLMVTARARVRTLDYDHFQPNAKSGPLDTFCLCFVILFFLGGCSLSQLWRTRLGCHLGLGRGWLQNSGNILPFPWFTILAAELIPHVSGPEPWWCSSTASSITWMDNCSWTYSLWSSHCWAPEPIENERREKKEEWNCKHYRWMRERERVYGTNRLGWLSLLTPYSLNYWTYEFTRLETRKMNETKRKQERWMSPIWPDRNRNPELLSLQSKKEGKEKGDERKTKTKLLIPEPVKTIN